MSLGKLAVVERWLDAVNRADLPTLLALTDDDLELVGPRGRGRGKELLEQWLARAGFRAEPVRWFCGANEQVVVEQIAQWSAPDASGASPPKRVSSSFTVRDERVARFQRFDELALALRAAGMGVEDEVLARS